MINIAVFASGSGTNTQKLIHYFQQHTGIKIVLVVSNKPGAGVLEIAEKEPIPSLIIEKDQFYKGDAYTGELKNRKIDFIVLAGFLWKVPSTLIQAYTNKIINIHPALLPKFGGTGMYGKHVHEAVIAAGEKESGITIHYVDELYDHGNIIFQVSCPVTENETPASLAEKIQLLEHNNYPSVIEKTVELQNHR